MLKTVDARGLQCPAPVIEAKKALKEVSEGTVEVLADNEIAVQNLLKLASYLNMEAASEKIAQDYYRVRFMVTDQADEAVSTETEELSLQEDRQNGYVVALPSIYMGDGDHELGRILMKGFVYALTQLDTLPETILLYNGGAKLSVEGAETLEDLKLLESQGAEILTCGTCLNHYGLAEKLAVGSVTNMYVIAEKMAQAHHIVKP